MKMAFARPLMEAKRITGTLIELDSFSFTCVHGKHL